VKRCPKCKNLLFSVFWENSRAGFYRCDGCGRIVRTLKNGVKEHYPDGDMIAQDWKRVGDEMRRVLPPDRKRN